jgi:hypothetical protein
MEREKQQEKNGTAKMHSKNLKKIITNKSVGGNRATRHLNIMAIINNDILIDIFVFSSRITLCHLEIICRLFNRVVNTYFKIKPYHVWPMFEITGYPKKKVWVSF